MDVSGLVLAVLGLMENKFRSVYDESLASSRYSPLAAQL